MIGLRTEKLTRSTKSLILGLLVAALVAGLPAARPAHAADTFTVDQTADTPDASIGDGDCDVNLTALGFQCTLRAAIEEANAVPGADLIRFAIPGSGVQTIRPNSPLPSIADPVTIDGYTQPGSSPNTLENGTNAVLKIELDGTNAQGAEGLDLELNSRSSVVKGLVINRFGSNGIFIGTPANKLEGNFIGTDPSGTQDLGNGLDGVEIRKAFSNSEPADSTIGGQSPAARNVISGNGRNGVSISANSTAGDHFVEGNYIGTDKNGSGDLGNTGDGVSISGSTGNVIGNGQGNTIAFNDGAGVSINTAFQGPATGNSVIFNSIFSNGGLGIDLFPGGVTENDGDNPNTPQVDPDSDTGPNDLQNFPVLSAALTSGAQVFVAGNLNSIPDSTFRVQFFASPEADPSGNGEGKTFLGQTFDVTTDSSGNASFFFAAPTPVPAGNFVTATASLNGSSTSEFSEGKVVSPLPHKKKKHRHRR